MAWGRSDSQLDAVGIQRGTRFVHFFPNAGSCILFTGHYDTDYGNG